MLHYKHIFFDLDDTFWDVRANQEAAQRELFATFGMADRFPDFDAYYGTFREINPRLCTALGAGVPNIVTYPRCVLRRIQVLWKSNNCS